MCLWISDTSNPPCVINITHGGFEVPLIHRRMANLKTVSVLFFRWWLIDMWRLVVHWRLCQLLLLRFCWLVWVPVIASLVLLTFVSASYCFSSFADWCEIKELQLLPFELGCRDWPKYMFWMLDTGWHCISVMSDQLFLFLFSVLAVVIFAPTQFNHFCSWIWMSWGKEMTITKLKLVKPPFSWQSW